MRKTTINIERVSNGLIIIYGDEHRAIKSVARTDEDIKEYFGTMFVNTLNHLKAGKKVDIIFEIISNKEDLQ